MKFKKKVSWKGYKCQAKVSFLFLCCFLTLILVETSRNEVANILDCDTVVNKF